METVQVYRCCNVGYDPFLISDGWQVAYLTAVDQHHLDDLVDMEVHKATDEVFILLSGKAVLVTSSCDGDKLSDFRAILMEPKVTYNIPAGVWHNIAMDSDALVMIVERSCTHISDVDHKIFDENEKRSVDAIVMNSII